MKRGATAQPALRRATAASGLFQQSGPCRSFLRRPICRLGDRELTESGRQGGSAAHRLRRHCGNPPPD